MSLVTPRKGYKLVPWLFGKEIEIPEEWENVNVEYVADKLLSGGTPSTIITEYWDGNIPWTKGAVLTTNNTTKGERFISELGLKNSSTSIISKDNLLVVSRVSIGNISINKIDIAINQDITAVILNKTICLTDFLYWNLLHTIGILVSFSQGTTIQGFTRKDLSSHKVLLPPLPEQQKIATILSNVDNLIESTGKVITHSKKVKTGLMQKLLTRGIGHTKFKEYFFTINGVISLGTIPSEWDISTINELNENDIIIDFQDGNHGELHPKKDDFINKGIPFLTASQIDENGIVDLLNSKKLPELFLNTLRIGFSKAKDVLFTHNATVGRVAVLPKNFPDCIVGTSVTYYRLDETKLNRIFFSYVLRSKFIKTQYGTEMDQTTRQQFSIRKQAKLKIPLPPLPEQQKIASILSNIDSKITSQEQYKEKLQLLKNHLCRNY